MFSNPYVHLSNPCPTGMMDLNLYKYFMVKYYWERRCFAIYTCVLLSVRFEDITVFPLYFGNDYTQKRRSCLNKTTHLLDHRFISYETDLNLFYYRHPITFHPYGKLCPSLSSTVSYLIFSSCSKIQFTQLQIAFSIFKTKC